MCQSLKVQDDATIFLVDFGESRDQYIYIYSITINYIHIIDIKNSGLLRTNIAPAKRSFEKGTHLPTRLCGMLFFEGCTVS